MTQRQILEAFSRGRLSEPDAVAALRALRIADGPARPRASQPDAQPIAAALEPIAVIGMSGRFPGAADLDTFWERLAGGICSVSEVPRSRWDIDRVYDPDPQAVGKTYSRCAGLLDEIDCFDPLFFNISPREAEHMDPQQRLFLEEAWRTFEDAGYSPQALAGRNCGVFAGVTPGDYHLLLLEHHVPQDAYTLVGNASAILASRIAYLLDLKGPCVSVDTASSSSAVAIHQACQSLRAGECEMALAGGVCVLTTPQTHIMTSKAGMLSRDGLCKTFDDSADGFVPAEGVGVLLLKPLRAAIDDGDHVYGVIAASGMNQNGSTNGITAPSARAQQELQSKVYEKFGIDPSTITYVECHGTGTKLGDPIEMAALCKVFERHTTRRQFCAVGSIKTNIGHAISAAGVASVMKVLLSLRHGTLPPSLHFNVPNEHIPFAGSPFYVNRQLSDWRPPPAGPRRAAVNCIGFSGTNVHFVIEDPPASAVRPRAVQPRRPVIVPLSARSPAVLAAYAGRLVAFLKRNEPAKLGQAAVRDRPSTFLDDLAYTLQVGRAPLPHRAALLVDDVEDLRSKLSACMRGHAVAGCYASDAERRAGQPYDIARAAVSNERHHAPETRRRLEALAQRWACGAEIDWNATYGADRPRRIPAPTYPFEKQRYWPSAPLVPASPPDAAEAADVADAVDAPSSARAPHIRPPDPDLEWTEERWVERPLRIDDATDWAQRLHSRRHASFLVLGRSARDQAAFESVARGLSQVMAAAGANSRVSWRFVDTSGLDASAADGVLRARPLPDVLVAFIACAVRSAATDSEGATPDSHLGQAAPHLEWVRAVHDRCRHQELDVYAVMSAGDGASLEVELVSTALESLALQSPRHRLTCIRHDFDAGDDRSAAVAVREWLSPGAERAAIRSIRYEAGRRLEAAVSEAPPPLETSGPRARRQTYLVTGRLGDVALSVGDALAQAGPSTLVLVPDRPLSLDERAGFAALRSARDAVIEMPHEGADWREQTERLMARAQGIDGVVCVVSHSDSAPVQGRSRDAALVPALLEKRWIEREPPAGCGREKVAGDALILVNQQSAELGRRLAETCFDGTVTTASIDEGFEPRDAHRGVTMLVDLADVFGESRSRDDDKLARMRVYQQLISSAPRLAVVHLTRHLHWFRCVRTSLAGAKLTGLVKMLGAEYRHVSARHVDVDLALEDVAGFAAIVRSELEMPARDPEVCYREGRRYVPILEERLVSLAEPVRSQGSRFDVAPDGVYVVSGGTSGVGLEVATHLAARGARRLVLMGITPLPPVERWSDSRTLAAWSPEVRQRVARLVPLIDAGVDLRLYLGPLDDEERVAAFLARIRGEWGGIRGMVHCAGRIPSAAEDTLAFARKDAEELQRVLIPKVRGLEVLAAQLAEDPLDFFLAFSSVAGIVPRLTIGVGDYGSANAFIDHFAAHQASMGRRHVQSIAWAGWSDAGVHTRLPGAGRNVERLVNECGIHFTTSREALRLLEQAVATPGATPGAMACLIDQATFRTKRAELLQVGDRSGVDRRGAAERTCHALANVDRVTRRGSLRFFLTVSYGQRPESDEIDWDAPRAFARWRQRRAEAASRHDATWYVRLPAAADGGEIARVLSHVSRRAVAAAASCATDADAAVLRTARVRPPEVATSDRAPIEEPSPSSYGLDAARPSNVPEPVVPIDGPEAALLDLDLERMSDKEIDELHAQVFARGTGGPGRADIEQAILAELRAVLKLGAVAVGPRDRFQSVGLDSISGTQLAIRLERSLGLEVPSGWLVEHDTVASLAGRILEAQPGTRALVKRTS